MRYVGYALSILIIVLWCINDLNENKGCVKSNHYWPEVLKTLFRDKDNKMSEFKYKVIFRKKANPALALTIEEEPMESLEEIFLRLLLVIVMKYFSKSGIIVKRTSK